mmetsp:Transcript_38452/g.107115  ORF Transcript_38452/g.107115 Transcript_38452/m.107115 type:complete len:140 (-) Transcript_38452:205-624(-)
MYYSVEVVEGQAVAVEKMPPTPRNISAGAIERVRNDGMANVAEVAADLVRPTCEDGDYNERKWRVEMSEVRQDLQSRLRRPALQGRPRCTTAVLADTGGHLTILADPAVAQCHVIPLHLAKFALDTKMLKTFIASRLEH